MKMEIKITLDEFIVEKIKREILKFRLERGYLDDFVTVRRVIECLVCCNVDWDSEEEEFYCSIAGYVQCEDDAVSDMKFDAACDVFGLDSAKMSKELHRKGDTNQRDVLHRLMNWISLHKKPKQVVRVLNKKTGKLEVVKDD